MQINLVLNEIPKLKVVRAIYKKLAENNLMFDTLSEEKQKIAYEVFNKKSQYKISSVTFKETGANGFVIDYYNSSNSNKVDTLFIKVIKTKSNLDLNRVYYSNDFNDYKEKLNKIVNPNQEESEVKTDVQNNTTVNGNKQ